MSPSGGRARNAGGPRVLFATSNGTGLGHLNRAMAIARRLPDACESSFFTLSGAAPVVARNGYPVDYLSSYRRPASGTDRAWNLRLGAMLEQVFEERRPDLVVFDGVHPYRALTHLLSARGAPRSIWCRRAMWRDGTAFQAPLNRVGAFDAVLEPGELAESADRGPTVPRRGAAKRVRPIVYLDPRRAARSPAGGGRPRPRPGPADRPGGARVRAATSTAPSPSRCAPWPRSRACRSRRCSRASPPTSRSRRASSASMRPSR